ncbi:MAG: hypothetical protein ABR543_04160 [Gemmatimonadaceae bacterium]
MITVSIAGMSVPFEKASEGWINQMIADARKRGVSLCIRVSINVPAARILLSTPGCGGGGGGSRPPNETEHRIFEAWNRRGLGQGTFTPGDLRAFLQDLGRLI